MTNKARAIEFISSSFNNLRESAELDDEPDEPKSFPSRYGNKRPIALERTKNNHPTEYCNQ